MNTAIGIDLCAAFFFSLSGTLTAFRYKKLDLYGLAFVAMITAVGGGTLRDILLGAHPIAWISRAEYILVIIAGFIMALIFRKWILKLNRPFVLADALGVAFAAIAGLQKSLEFSANPVVAIFFGVISATCGGIIRDIICNEVPMVLRSEFYASIILIGCSLYFLLANILELDPAIAYVSAFVFMVMFRMISLKFQWNLQPDKWIKKWNKLQSMLLVRRNRKRS